MKLMKKTLLASAVALASGSTFAVVDYDFPGAEETVVLASEIFGDENGTGSEETLIVMKNTQVDLDTAVAGILDNGDNINAAATATIKFTLGGSAVFGEDLSTTAAVLAANGGAGAFTCTAGAPGSVVADSVTNDNVCGLTADNDATFEVVQGGAIGDNTITFEITAIAAEQSIGGVTFGNVAIKNLTSALGDQGSATHRGSVQMGIEYVEGAETTADTITTTATDTPLVIFGSQPGLELTGTPVDFEAANFIRINVGNGELTFTGGTGDGRSDFDPAGDAAVVNLGTVQLVRSAIDTATFTDAAAGTVKKENGADFDFQGGDTHSFAITAGTGSFQAETGSNIFLSTDNTCAAEVHAGLTVTGSTVTAAGLSAALSGSTTALTTSYNLCYVTDGVAQIPEVGSISAAWDVDFFNTRYDDESLTKSPYGDLVRNGCIASFFNIPGSDNANDTAFIRLTNTSSTNAGDIRGTLYAQDGTILGSEVTVAPELAIHATQVFTSQAADITTAHGQTLVSIENAFGTTPSDYKGRGRLVLKGAFDTCEGLGLIRNASTGALYNMTSTTQGNEAAAPNDGNNAN